MPDRTTNAPMPNPADGRLELAYFRSQSHPADRAGSRSPTLSAFLSGAGPKLRHGLLEHVGDDALPVALDATFQFGQPLPQRCKRRLLRLRGHDAVDPDIPGRLLFGEQDFMQPLARPDTGEHDV